MPIEKTYSQSPFKGQIFLPATVTPFAPSGDIMWDALPVILEWYLARKPDALMIAGNNGEGYALNETEFAKLAREATRIVAGRIPLYMHVTRTSNKESLRLAHVAADAGAPGISLMAQPYIHAATKAEIVDRFALVGKEVPLPMLVFNSHHYTQVTMTPDILGAIADVAPVVCVKDTVYDYDHITQMIATFGNRFPMLWGGRTLIWSLLMGSGGFVGTGVEFFGLNAKQQFLGVHEATPEQRLKLAMRFKTVIDAVQRFSPPPSGLKAALNMVGLPAGVPREPVQPVTPDVAARIRAALVEAGVLAQSERMAAQSA
jgi:4-hydroxy-tetrahydrodipicolinate synthase